MPELAILVSKTVCVPRPHITVHNMNMSLTTSRQSGSLSVGCKDMSVHSGEILPK